MLHGVLRVSESGLGVGAGLYLARCTSVDVNFSQSYSTCSNLQIMCLGFGKGRNCDGLAVGRRRVATTHDPGAFEASDLLFPSAMIMALPTLRST
jgi:hypothetical protein